MYEYVYRIWGKLSKIISQVSWGNQISKQYVTLLFTLYSKHCVRSSGTRRGSFPFLLSRGIQTHNHCVFSHSLLGSIKSRPQKTPKVKFKLIVTYFKILISSNNYNSGNPLSIRVIPKILMGHTSYANLLEH